MSLDIKNNDNELRLLPQRSPLFKARTYSVRNTFSGLLTFCSTSIFSTLDSGLVSSLLGKFFNSLSKTAANIEKPTVNTNLTEVKFPILGKKKGATEEEN